MDGPDINSPFAQALIETGKQRGYTPFDIAASIGNAYQENSLKTDGLPGDNGTAFGGMQWRNDRFDKLKATAQKMGLPWTDPKVQAAHWYDEQDAAGNKGATSVDDANDNVIGSLRPAGFKQDDPDNTKVHGYDNRLKNSQSVYAALAGGNPGDLPAPGAQEAQGALSQGQLPGQPQQVPQYQPTIGDNLSKLSAAFMRRDSPGAASAINNELNAKIQQQQAFLKAQQASDSWTNTGKVTVGQDGIARRLVTNDKTGASRTEVVPQNELPKEDPEAEKPAGPAEVRAATQQSAAVQNLEQLEPVRNAVNTLREALQKGTFQVGPDATGKMVLNNITGNSTENDRYLKSMQSNIINAASIVAQSQKGSMTNFKFAKDMEQVMPSFASNDKKAAYEALTRVSEGIAGAYNGNVSAVNKYGTMFPKTLGTVLDPATGEMVPIGEHYKGKVKTYADREKAMHDATPEFLASPGRGQSATGAPAIGFTKGGYKFMGGDPGNQASWQKAE